MFDGSDDYVDLPAFGTCTTCTVDVWVNFASTTGNQPIMNDDGWSRGDLHYQIYAGQFGFDVNGQGDRTFRWQPEPDSWYYISVVYRMPADAISLRIDGAHVEDLTGHLRGSNPGNDRKGWPDTDDFQ